MTVTYQAESGLGLAEYIAILEASGLAERRPVRFPDRMAANLTHSGLIVTARTETGELVGIARSITDWSAVLYCADLAVASSHKGLGIGKRLLAETVKLAPDVLTFFLVSAPGAVGFYEQAGYQRLDDTFVFHRNPLP